jgi:hypothetical protein
LAWIGIIHAYRLTNLGVENHFAFGAAPDFALAYALTALMLWGLHWSGQRVQGR